MAGITDIPPSASEKESPAGNRGEISMAGITDIPPSASEKESPAGNRGEISLPSLAFGEPDLCYLSPGSRAYAHAGI